MLDSKRLNDDFVLTYKYQKSYEDYDNQGIYCSMQKCEYFIPSMNICFNNKEVFRSKKPQNLDKAFYQCESFLKKVLLPKGLINEITNQLDESLSAPLILNDKKIFEDIPSYPFFAREDEFQQNYERYGSFVLPHYIFRYIDNVSLNKNSNTAKRIFEVIDSLDEVEKKSLENCLTGMIQERDNRHKKYNVKEIPISLPTGLLSVGIGVASAVATESNPVGVFAGALTLFGIKKYNALLKNRCEEFQNKVFEALKTERVAHQASNRY